MENRQPNSAWHPDGTPVRLQAEVDMLRQVSAPGMDVSPTEAAKREPRFLHLWFAHPRFDRETAATVTLSGPRGEPWPLAADGSFASGRHLAEPASGGVGWVITTLSPGEQNRIPERLAVRLNYSLGPIERVQEVAPDFDGSMALAENAHLNGLGQNAQGKAFVALAVEPKPTPAVVPARAVTRDGRELVSSGSQIGGATAGPVRVERFEFDLFPFRT